MDMNMTMDFNGTTMAMPPERPRVPGGLVPAKECAGFFSIGSMAAMFLGGCMTMVVFYYILYMCMFRSRAANSYRSRSRARGPILDEMTCHAGTRNALVEEAINRRLATLEHKATLKRAAQASSAAQSPETPPSPVSAKPLLLPKPNQYRLATLSITPVAP